ncbi:MAG: ABC transporter substrate-binding protein [Caldilineaceae bacterium]
MKARSFVSMFLVGLALLQASCIAPQAAPAGSQAPKSGGAAAGAKPVVALVYGVKNDGFYITMEKGVRDKAAELGMDVIADGPAQFDPVQQKPILDAVIAQNPAAICIAATDKQAMIEPIKAAFDKGIHIFSVDTFIGSTAGDYTKGDITFPLSYIGSDNVEGGKIACKAVIDAMGGKGKMYIQNVKPGISTTDQREQGCKEAIDATNGAVTLVGTDYNGDDSSKAAEQTSAVLAANKDLGGIFGTNLFSARGAAQAVQNAGLTGAIKIANFDAPEDAVKALQDKVVDLVIAQHPYEIGQTCVQYANDAINGKTDQIKKRFATGYTVITRDNVDKPESQQAIYKSK